MDALRRSTARKRNIYDLLAVLCFSVCLVAAGYIGWKLLVQDHSIVQQQVADAAALNAAVSEPVTPPGEPSPAPSAPVAVDGHTAPPIVETPVAGEDFATIYVPRFGEDYVRVLREGTDVEDVLNQGRVGRYEGTAMPGAVGNFAVAAHRSAYGGAFHLLPDLEPGDRIYVRAAEGWYTYSYTTQRVVAPTEVSVLAPVPGQPGVAPTARMMTLTTCDPLYSSAQRIAAVAEFVSWQPLSAGAPGELHLSSLDGSE
ncbi:sortase A [Rathayibacter agropyri]